VSLGFVDFWHHTVIADQLKATRGRVRTSNAMRLRIGFWAANFALFPIDN
jgi:hypothetical protein